MPRQPIYQNASLIREVRMIAQQFFQTKRDEAFWGSFKKPQSTPSTALLRCVFCIKENASTTVTRPAVTIYNGNATCVQHLL